MVSHLLKYLFQKAFVQLFPVTVWGSQKELAGQCGNVTAEEQFQVFMV